MTTMSYKLRKLFILPVILLAVVVFSVIAMLLWNALMPHIFNLPVLNFWQAAGLLILARLFFGGARPHYRGPWHGYPWKRSIREKVSNMSPEERRDFFRKLHEYRHFKHDDFWGTETGKDTREKPLRDE